MLADGTLTLRLRAPAARWRPEGPGGPGRGRSRRSAKTARPAEVPAPLIRVPEGTAIVVSIRNELAAPLARARAVRARRRAPARPSAVPPAATREVRFASGRAGTYHYWASAFGAPVPFREMAGAFVVDPAGAAAEPTIACS